MASGIVGVSLPNHNDRFATFVGYWDNNEATARQLAAIGHVYDRPPLEAIDEGSRCCSCSAFVPREVSIQVLEGPLSDSSEGCNFHSPRCDRLQVRIPLDSHMASTDQYGGRTISTMRNRFESNDRARADQPRPRHTGTTNPGTNFFSLPVELRLEIYSIVLPPLPQTTSIVPLNRDSNRVVTSAVANKVGRRDYTQINLLATCKIIHREALGFLFHKRAFRFQHLSSNNFNSTSSKTLYLFLRHIGAQGRAELECVDIQLGGREDAIAFALLASCRNLKSITIRHSKPHLIAVPTPPVWLVEGIASFLSLRGLGNVNFANPEQDECRWLHASDQDAIVITRELSKNRGEPSSVRFVDGRWLDL